MWPQGSSEVVQHRLSLVMEKQESVSSKPSRQSADKQGLALGMLTVSVVFRPVASVAKSSPECHVTSIGGAGHLSFEAESSKNGVGLEGGKRKYLKTRKAKYEQQGQHYSPCL